MQPPIPQNEDERVWALTEFDIDYTDTSDLLKDLVELAAKIAGTKISLVNLIDTYEMNNLFLTQTYFAQRNSTLFY